MYSDRESGAHWKRSPLAPRGLVVIVLGWPPSASATRIWSVTERGLSEIDAVAGELDSYHLLHAARADLLRRLGRRDEAADAYRRAHALAGAAAERRFLERRLAEVT